MELTHRLVFVRYDSLNGEAQVRALKCPCLESDEGLVCLALLDKETDTLEFIPLYF